MSYKARTSLISQITLQLFVPPVLITAVSIRTPDVTGLYYTSPCALHGLNCLELCVTVTVWCYITAACEIDVAVGFNYRHDVLDQSSGASMEKEQSKRKRSEGRNVVAGTEGQRWRWEERPEGNSWCEEVGRELWWVKT